MSFLKSRYAIALTIVLLLQAGALYAVASRPELAAPIIPLSLFPATFGGWTMVQDVPLEPEVLDMLKADDTMNRVYVDRARTADVNLFVAYFKTQRYGQSPHSPKNCLPGSGWEEVEVGRQTIPVAGWDRPITVNRYAVEHGDEQSVTLYWYQGHHRVIASEFAAKFWLVADAVRYRRSDTALARVIVPVRGGDLETATNIGVAFIQAAFPVILRQMPL
ncbi:MAG: exosortase C-terminal domain/associated protein EpsI [Bryobacteraceae bacterium]